MKKNKPKVDEFRKAELDEYLDEALFLLELIGVTNFSSSEKSKDTISRFELTQKAKTEIRSKSEALLFLSKSAGISIKTKYISYARRQDKGKYFWNNARASKTCNEWSLILNDQIKKCIYVLDIPGNAFKFTRQSETGKISLRKDKPFYRDLNINTENFIDKKSSIDFSKFIINKVLY